MVPRAAGEEYKACLEAVAVEQECGVFDPSSLVDECRP